MLVAGSALETCWPSELTCARLGSLTADRCLSSVLCVRGANPDDFHRTAGVPGYRLGYPAHQKTVEALPSVGAKYDQVGMPFFSGVEDF